MLKEKVLSFFSFKIKMKQIFTINKPHIIKNLNINNIYFYCLDPSSINILVQLLVEYSNYSNKCCIQRCSTYQRGGTSQGAVLIGGPALIRVNTVYNIFKYIYIQIQIYICIEIYINRDSLHARPNSHYEVWHYKKKKHKKIKHIENLFRKNLQLKDVCQFQT